MEVIILNEKIKELEEKEKKINVEIIGVKKKILELNNIGKGLEDEKLKLLGALEAIRQLIPKSNKDEKPKTKSNW